jgi:hypothetical protein
MSGPWVVSMFDSHVSQYMDPHLLWLNTFLGNGTKALRLCISILISLYKTYLCHMLQPLIDHVVLTYIHTAFSQPSYLCSKLAIQLVRRFMLKHDFKSLQQSIKSKASYSDCVLLMRYYYPLHYATLHLVLCGAYQGFAIASESWYTVYAWYDFEMLISNRMHCNGNKASETFILSWLMDSISSISHWYHWDPSLKQTQSTNLHIGGGITEKSILTYNLLKSYVLGLPSFCSDDARYKYISHLSCQEAMSIVKNNTTYLVCRIPLEGIAPYLTLGQAKAIAKIHSVFVPYRAPLSIVLDMLVKHQCSTLCYDNVFMFKPASVQKKCLKAQVDTKKYHISELKRRQTHAFKQKRSAENKKAYIRTKEINDMFSPTAPDKSLLHKIINAFCKDTHPSKFQEAGCAVCGLLTPLNNLLAMNTVTCSLNLLKTGLACHECNTEGDKQSFTDPVINPECQSMCKSCYKYLDKKQMPPMALANGLWLGKVPKELSGLTFVEKLLISKVRRN